MSKAPALAVDLRAVIGHHPAVSSPLDDVPGSAPQAHAAQQHRFVVPAEAQGMRLDQCLAKCLPQLSRRTARIVLDLGGVFIDRKRVKVASRKVFPGQDVVVNLGTAFTQATKTTGNTARAWDEARLPAPVVLFEDSHIIVVVKPAGLLSAPTPESDRNNLVSVLAHRRVPPEQLYVVHRLDLHTSGVLVLARTLDANRKLSELFRSHELTRLYDVWVQGYSDAPFTCDIPVGGKAARTQFTPLEHHTISPTQAISRLEARLETGRTHQVRVHAASCGHPVLADLRYGMRAAWHPPRLALHAKHLAFQHPTTGEHISFDVPLPDDLTRWLRQLTGQTSPEGPTT